MTRARMSSLFLCSRYATCLRFRECSASSSTSSSCSLPVACRALAGSPQRPRHALVSGLLAASLSCAFSRVSRGHIPPRWVRDVECPPSGIPSVAVNRSVWIQVQTLSLPALRRRQPLSGQSNRQRESLNVSRTHVHSFSTRMVGLMYRVDSFILVTSVSAYGWVQGVSVL